MNGWPRGSAGIEPSHTQNVNAVPGRRTWLRRFFGVATPNFAIFDSWFSLFVRLGTGLKPARTVARTGAV